jgi:hypothetical protein
MTAITGCANWPAGSTSATKSTYRTNSETVNDGTRTTDSVTDTDVDD